MSGLPGEVLPAVSAPAARASRVPRRALLLGTALIPVSILWLHQLEIVWYSSEPTTISLYYHVVCIVLALMAANVVLRRVRPAWVLQQNELLVIYVMLAIANSLAGHDQIEILIPTLADSSWFATPGNRWQQLFGNALPDWLLVTDDRALRGFHEGEVSLWRSGAWHAWVGPLAWWGGFIGALFLTTLALNVLLRKQWTERERLSYPIAQIPLSITGDFRVWRSRLFLLGFGLAFAIDALNGFAAFFPALPSLPTRVQSVELASWPWSATGGFTVAFYPFAIGLGYLLPVDLLFSCWFFYWFWKAQCLLTAVLGFGDRPGFPYVTQQCSGGYLGICLFSLWMARRHLAAAVRRAVTGAPVVDDREELVSYRVALAGLVLGVGALLWFALRLGVPLLTAAAFFGIYFALSTAVTRMRAELGPPAHDLHYGGPDVLLPAAFGTAALGPRTLVFFSITYWMNRALRSQPMPHQMEGLRIGERRALGRGPLLAAILIAGVVGVVAAFGSLLYAGYHYGWSTSKMGYAAQVFGREPYDRLASWFTFPPPADPGSAVAVLVGVLVSLGLLALRLQFVWWPLHPVGYAVSSSWSMNLLWMPLAIAWAVKLAVLRYGGLGLYRRALPLFLGLVLGEYVAGGLWSLLGIALHRAAWVFWPY